MSALLRPLRTAAIAAFSLLALATSSASANSQCTTCGTLIEYAGHSGLEQFHLLLLHLFTSIVGSGL